MISKKKGWEWVDELHLDMTGKDKDGWEYAFNWEFNFSSSHSEVNTFVRRRRWVV